MSEKRHKNAKGAKGHHRNRNSDEEAPPPSLHHHPSTQSAFSVDSVGSRQHRSHHVTAGPGAHRHHHDREEVPLPKPSQSQYSLILLMEAKARIELWKRMPMDTLRSLRLTCHRIKFEIDHNVGIALCVDDSIYKGSFYSIASKVGIQHLRIRKLTSDRFFRFLLHPFLLQKLEIAGEISQEYAAYIFQSCPNIRFLLVHFTHHMLHRHYHLFPVAAPYHGLKVGAFPDLTHLHVACSTGSSADFQHMSDSLHALLTQDLKYARIKDFHVHVNHDASPQNLKSFNSFLTLFVNNNSGTLEDLTIEITQRQVKLGQNSVRQLLETNSSTAQSAVWKSQWMAPEKVNSSASLARQSVTSTVQVTSELNYAGELETWNEFPVLRKLHIKVNKFAYFWSPAFTRATAIESLYLDMKISSNWEAYVATITASAGTLNSIQLHTVNRGNFGIGHKPDLRIDLSVFQPCKKLSRLGIMCKEDEVLGTNYRLTSIRSIFRVSRLEFAWVHLSPCQLTTLLTFSTSLRHIDLQYCTSSDWELGAYFCRWRWLMGLRWTRVSVITVIDHKVRFQGNKKSVDQFLAAQWRHAVYYDGFYIKVVYSKAIENESRGAQKRFAFPRNRKTGQGGTTEIMTGEEGDGDDEAE